MKSYVCRRVAFSILSAAILTCVLAQSSWAATVAVGNCTNLAFYPTIQQAVNSVPVNSIIKICPGTYPEQVVINKSMTLTGVSSNGFSGTAGSGADNPVIVSPTGGVVANSSDLFNGSPIAGQIVVVTPAGAKMQTKVTLNYIAVDGSNNQLASCGTDLVGIYYQNASGTINQTVTRNQEWLLKNSISQ
jgi:nitrous oxidase accessory protein NosD